jgi:hypothetical protein
MKHTEHDEHKEYNEHIEHSSNAAVYKPIFIRGAYILLFLVIGYITIFVSFFVILFQFLSELIFKKPNEYLLHFGKTLSHYASDILNFVTYNTEEKPFPFKSWPKVKMPFITEKN